QKWWAALLASARSGRRQPGGVALLDATLASGRRFTKAYLVGATEGSYGAREREDYFISEEARAGADDLLDGDLPELLRVEGRPLPSVIWSPRRLQRRDADVVEELLSRADHLVVPAPAADQSGPLISDAALLGTSPLDLPEVPAGSSLELPGAVPYVPEFDGLYLGSPTAEYLQEYAQCALKAWGKRSLPTSWADDAEVPEWIALREALLSEP